MFPKALEYINFSVVATLRSHSSPRNKRKREILIDGRSLMLDSQWLLIANRCSSYSSDVTIERKMTMQWSCKLYRHEMN
jgi:hypothetical protein